MKYVRKVVLDQKGMGVITPKKMEKYLNWVRIISKLKEIDGLDLEGQFRDEENKMIKGSDVVPHLDYVTTTETKRTHESLFYSLCRRAKIEPEWFLNINARKMLEAANESLPTFEHNGNGHDQIDQEPLEEMISEPTTKSMDNLHDDSLMKASKKVKKNIRKLKKRVDKMIEKEKNREWYTEPWQ